MRTFEETAYDESDLLAGRALARSGRLGAIMVLPSMASAVVDPGTDRAVMAQAKVASLLEHLVLHRIMDAVYKSAEDGRDVIL